MAAAVALLLLCLLRADTAEQQPDVEGHPSVEHQANFIAGSDTVAEQQSADAQNADAAVLGAAGAAARAALRAAPRG